MNFKNWFKKDEEAAAPASSFQAGQVWKYQTRAAEPDSTLIVCRVESVGDQTVVHISLRDVKIRVPNAPDGFSSVVGHMPVAEAALADSVTELVAEGSALPQFEDGYRQWKKAKGGFWTMPVAECIETMETAMNS
jgi:hypothetical protein